MSDKEYDTGAYQIRNLTNGKVYIGGAYSSFEKRWKIHTDELNKSKHPNPILQKAWNKHGKNNFVFEILERCEPIRDIIISCEQRWLDTVKPPNSKICYNICPNAESRLGAKESKESCRLKSEIRKGKLPYPGAVANLSRKGTKHSEETKAHWSKIRTGRKQSDETISKRVSKLTGQKRSEEFCSEVSKRMKLRYAAERAAREKEIERILESLRNPVRYDPEVEDT